MLVLLYVPNSPKVVISTSIIAVGTTAFNNMLINLIFLKLL